MKILAVHRYFWPDTPPYAALLRVIAEHWAERGHEVEVLSSQPSYKPELAMGRVQAQEVLNGVRVSRLPMKPDRVSARQRLANTVKFPVLVFGKVLLGPKRDVVMCSTAPPVVLALMTCFAARVRGARFVYHCMDLHPEIGRLSGEFRNPAVYSLLRALDTWTCRQAHRVVVLSDDMAEALLSRDPSLASKIRIITNFEIPAFDAEAECIEDSPGSPSRRLRLVFTGNIGRFQGLQRLTRAVLDPGADDGVELVLMGEGSAKSELESMVASAPPHLRQRVTLLPHGSVAAATALMRSADLGVVSLSPGVIRYAYPSKTASYLAQGLPVLAAVEADSQLARQIRDWNVGGLLPTDDPLKVTEELRTWVSRRAEIAGLRERAKQVWARVFAADQVLPQWDELVESMANG